MQRIDEIRELFEYTRWADDRILRTALEISNEQFTRDMGSSFRSIRDTLVHILTVHWVWVSRWEGISPREIPREWKECTQIELRRAWTEVSHRQSAFIAELSEADLDRVIRYTNTAGQPFAAPLSRLLRHVVNHATYHRGQVATMLRQIGLTPPGTDLTVFYLETNALLRAD